MFGHIESNNITAKQSTCYPMNFNSRFASVIEPYQGRAVDSAANEALQDESLTPTISSTEHHPKRIESDQEQRPGQYLLVDFPSGSKRRNVHSDSEDESSISTISVASGGKNVQKDAIALLVNAFGFRTAVRTMQKEKGDDPVSKHSCFVQARTSNQGTPATMAPNFPTIVVFETKARHLRR